MVWSCEERSSWYFTDVLYTIFLQIQSLSQKDLYTASQCSSDRRAPISPKQNVTPPLCQSKDLSPSQYHTHQTPSPIRIIHILSSPTTSHFPPSYKYTLLITLKIPTPSLRQIKPKSPHTVSILAHQIPTRGLRIFGGGEQHALVARGFLFFAHAAGLRFCGRAVDGVAGGFVGGGEVVDLLEGVGGYGGVRLGLEICGFEDEDGWGKDVLAAGADIVNIMFLFLLLCRYAQVELTGCG